MEQLKARIMDEAAVGRALRRISYEILEHNRGAQGLVLVGICRRGVPLAERISACIAEIEKEQIPVGKLDIICYRDDLGEGERPDPVVAATDIPFDITGRHVILVDDVLYTGRTVRAAIDALVAMGRPASVQLAILCDRGHREFPIRADYVGKNLPTSKTERVAVKIPPFDEEVCMELHEIVH
jgi:pyrimidine operon attenuation protein/uracil phosphoribosyltransferase